jgi:hypothetical protein
MKNSFRNSHETYNPSITEINGVRLFRETMLLRTIGTQMHSVGRMQSFIVLNQAMF